MNTSKSKQLARKEKKAPNDSLRKHVAAIHTSGELSLLERKMANVLLLNAYDDLITKRTHKISVKILTSMLGWDESNNIEKLKIALKKLTATSITFNLMEDGKEYWAAVSMLSFGEIKNGICSYRYDEFLAEKLYDPEIYSTINIKVQRELKGGYSLALYENCLRYKSVGSTGWWDLDKFRRLVGAEGEYYDAFKVLNARLIKPAVEEVNKSSDIRIEPEFQREQRKIISIRFSIEENTQQTIFNAEKTDEFIDIRETSTYQKLREHGIGEKLAITWVLQDEKKANEVIAYVEEKDKKKKIKSSTGAYIRKLIEEGAEVGQSPYEEKKEEARLQEQEKVTEQEEQKHLEELKLKYKKEKILAAVNRLSLPEKKKLIQTYLDSDGKGRGKSYVEDRGIFRDSLENFQFNAWLRVRFSPPIPSEEFNQWLQERRKAEKSSDG